MAQATYSNSYDDLEELRKSFEDFRSKHPARTRFPEELWRAAAEMAKRRGMNLVCRCLRLDANSLKKWMSKGVKEPRRKQAIKKHQRTAPPAAFVELLTAATAATSCVIEVESQHGRKLRLELKGVATSEIAELIHTFAGH